jgi:Ala-tRNA(Pro) deacylase
MGWTTPVLDRWEAVRQYLDRHGADYEPLQHETVMSALEVSAATGYPPLQVAKTIVLRNSGLVLVLAPASERVDVARLRRILRPRGDLRFATEREIASAFPLMEVGATPPVGTDPPACELIDWRLMEQDEVVFAGGDHRHSFVASPSAIVALAHATVANVCGNSCHARSTEALGIRAAARFRAVRRSPSPSSGMSTTRSSTPDS